MGLGITSRLSKSSCLFLLHTALQLFDTAHSQSRDPFEAVPLGLNHMRTSILFALMLFSPHKPFTAPLALKIHYMSTLFCHSLLFCLSFWAVVSVPCIWRIPFHLHRHFTSCVCSLDQSGPRTVLQLRHQTLGIPWGLPRAAALSQSTGYLRPPGLFNPNRRSLRYVFWASYSSTNSNKCRRSYDTLSVKYMEHGSQIDGQHSWVVLGMIVLLLFAIIKTRTAHARLSRTELTNSTLPADSSVLGLGTAKKSKQNVCY